MEIVPSIQPPQADKTDPPAIVDFFRSFFRNYSAISLRLCFNRKAGAEHIPRSPEGMSAPVNPSVVTDNPP
jgi:hypothetical protein